MVAEKASRYGLMTPNIPKTPAVRQVSLLSGKQYTKIISTIDKARQAMKLTDPASDATPPRFRLPSESADGSIYRDDIEFFEAPLNSRMHRPSPRQSRKVDDVVSLHELGYEAHEAFIIQDLLYVLMGIEGHYIRFADEYSPDDPNQALEGPKFRLDPALDPSLRNITEKILPLATLYASIDAFIERYSRFEFGMINHALCAVIRSLLKEYLILIAQLEHQFQTDPNFTLQKFWFYVHPTLQTLTLIWSPCSSILKASEPSDSDDDDEYLTTHVLGDQAASHLCIGGKVLGLLAEKLTAQSGNPTAYKLYRHLLLHAAAPYLTMLNRWIRHGEIFDPYDEFLIRESKSVRKENLDTDYTDEYWEKRYTLRADMTPAFLDPHKDKILLAGKYLNVLRECGLQVDHEPDEIGKATENDIIMMNDKRFVEYVDKAYAKANKALLDLLLKEQNLLPRLQALKHYFFLDQSDFFTHFLDISAHELSKKSKSASLTKLQSLLDLSLRNPSSVSANDPYKDDVCVSMASLSLVDALMRIVNVHGLKEGEEALTAAAMETAPGVPISDSSKSLSGIDAFVLDYSVKFPLSLVISRKTLFRYQLLFRHLLYIKHVEQLLTKSWIEHAKSPAWRKDSVHKGLTAWKKRAHRLRMRMLNFIQQLAYFTTFEVFEPQWMRFQEKLQNVSTVDQLLQDHVDFLDSCLKESMLTNAKLLKIYSKLMASCALFANYTMSQFTSAVIATERELGPYYPGYEGEEDGIKVADPAAGTPEETVSIEKLTNYLSKFEENFGANLKVLVEALNWYAATETLGFLHLVVRLEPGTEGQKSM